LRNVALASEGAVVAALVERGFALSMVEKDASIRSLLARLDLPARGGSRSTAGTAPTQTDRVYEEVDEGECVTYAELLTVLVRHLGVR
jgi:hypothetical protein